jgi:S1-C subfamily serine protease
MEQLVLFTVLGPDPKLVKSGLTPNSSAKDGQTRLASTGKSLTYFPTSALITAAAAPQYQPFLNNSIFTNVGLIFSALPGIVITSLLPIYPFLQPQFRSRPSTVTPAGTNGNPTLLPGARITCSFPGLASPNVPNTSNQEVYLERIIELKDVRTALRSLLTAPSASKWSLGWGSHSYSNGELPLETQLDLGSHVVVLKMTGDIRRSTAAATNFLMGDLSSLQLGTPVTAHGCPFGALVSLKFHNFMISGAISAVLEKKQQQQQTLSSSSLSADVALSDLKLLPGMEGGVVTINNNDKYHVIGILGPPLRAPEAHAELSVIISMTSVLDAVSQTLDKLPPTPAGKFGTHDKSNNIKTSTITTKEKLGGVLFSEALKAVVAVQANNGWASGVLISKYGHILTNAHALPPAVTIKSKHTSTTSSVRVLINTNWVIAEVIHIFSAPIDLALLNIKNSTINNSTFLNLPKPMRLGDCPFEPGRSVAVAGYPLWRPSNTSSNSTRPLVTVGTAALMIPAAPALPAVILTTADVHAGASGGAVFDLETGFLLGLVTSNTRLGRSSSSLPPQQASRSPRQQGDGDHSINNRKEPSILFPHLNYCLGSAALAPVIEVLTKIEGGSLQRSDWHAVETRLEESGVVEAWHSMRRMKRLKGSCRQGWLS